MNASDRGYSPARRRLLGAALAWAATGPLALARADQGGSRLWLDAAGRPMPGARAALALLADAASHGLDPDDYGGAAIARAIEHDGATPAAAEAADQALTRAFERYLNHLHRGRIDPRALHNNFRFGRPDAFDAAQVLRVALERQDPAAAVAAAVPPIPLYQRLREALARYRALGLPAAWEASLPPLPRPEHLRGAGVGRSKLEPGQRWSGLERLAQRLRLLGDLDPGQGLPAAPEEGAPRYEGALVEAVRRFQERHGLASDGVIGVGTLAQLEVAPPARVRQIELALERLRWTPLLQARRMIAINLPEFMLRAYEVRDDGRIEVSLESRVVVGKALDTRTPVFDEDMRFIEFSPYWNVPPSIARHELIPKIRRDPGYFARMGFEFVQPGGSVVTGLSASMLDAVLKGTARIRQRPGPENALGDIKFVFPNRDNIYLHHTPAVQLFGRERRDYSHGCIRVEQPVELAEFVLRETPGWDRERIEAAMQRGESSTLRLAQPVPVLISYGTTWIKSGRIYFFNDIYGHDRVLDAALRQRTRARPD